MFKIYPRGLLFIGTSRSFRRFLKGLQAFGHLTLKQYCEVRDE